MIIQAMDMAACTPGEYTAETQGLSKSGKATVTGNAIIAAVAVTFGGLEVDVNVRVPDTENKPIPGLYATGEVAFTSLVSNLWRVHRRELLRSNEDKREA